MLFAIIKNNFKLMFRNKLIIAMMIVLPILVIAALSSAFQGLLDGYEAEDVTIGYCIEEDSPFAEYEKVFTDAFADQDIKADRYGKEDMEDVIRDGRADVFLYSDKDGFSIASSDSESIQTKICVYFVSQIIEEYELGTLNIRRLAAGEEELEKTEIRTSSLPYTKTADAEDYYGIIEIIYFLWCGIFFLTAVVQSERKNRIQRRFLTAPVNGVTMYLGKFIPCELMLVLSTAVTAVVSTLLFDIHWGNLPGTVGILILGTLASTAYSILLLYIVNNLAVSVVLLFGTVWFAGFVGGSFETYMYSRWAESVKILSPLYHLNRTVVEYSTMGHSDYTGDCIIYMLGMIAVCTVLGSFLMKRRMEEK